MKTIAINIPSNLTKVEDVITAIKVYGHKNTKYHLSIYGKEELLITLEGVEGISINKGEFNPLSNFLNDKEVIGIVDFESKNELVSTYKIRLVLLIYLTELIKLGKQYSFFCLH